MAIRELRSVTTASSRIKADWWSDMSPDQQEQYLTDHPNSQKAKEAREAEQKQTQPQSDQDKAPTKKVPMVQVSVATKIVDGKRVQADGKPLPPHIQKLVLPPAWTDVKINPNPDGALLAQGKDSKGRVQSVYSEAFVKTQAEAKFRRIEELNEKFEDIHAENETARKSKDPKIKDSADCLALIMKTGIRPGSDEDTGAAKKAYGATTLQGNHVVKTESGVELHFTGKKGVDLKIPVTDPELAKMLLARAKEAGAEGKLFPKTNDKNLLAHVHMLDGGGFKAKDFRTHLACETAVEEISKMPVPTNDKEYKAAVTKVAKIVSTKLGNTPTVALQSYIAPEVWSAWQLSSKGETK